MKQLRSLTSSICLDRKPKALSGGQRQRVAMGRAIVRDPKVFLMDEPLSNLDAKLRVQMRIEISKLHQRLETTIIYVTHDQTEALTLGTRIVVMKDGVVQQVDTPLDLYMRPNNLFVAGFIGSPQMNFIDAKSSCKRYRCYVLCLVPTPLNFRRTKLRNLIENGYKDKDSYHLVFVRKISKMRKCSSAALQIPSLEATVKVYEMLGAEVFLYFTVETIRYYRSCKSSYNSSSWRYN